MTSVYDYTARSLDGSEVALSDYRGKVLLTVNTASKCGFTLQYSTLEVLYKQYQGRRPLRPRLSLQPIRAPGIRLCGRDRRVLP